MIFRRKTDSSISTGITRCQGCVKESLQMKKCSLSK